MKLSTNSQRLLCPNLLYSRITQLPVTKILVILLVFWFNPLCGQNTHLFSSSGITDAQLTATQLSQKQLLLQKVNVRSLDFINYVDPFSVMTAGKIPLQIPGSNEVYYFNSKNIEQYSNGNYSWYGEIVDSSPNDSLDLTGFILLTRHDGTISGSLEIDTTHYHFIDFGGSVIGIVRVGTDPSDNFGCIDTGAGPLTPDDKNGGSPPDGPSKTIRVLNLYTVAALAANPAVASQATNAFGETRQALLNSKILPHQANLQLVGTFALTNAQFTETASAEGVSDLEEILQVNSPIRQLKATYCADIVIVITAAVYTALSGRVAAFGDYSTSGDSAFALVEEPSFLAPATEAFTYSHEVGHLFGCRHQWNTNCETADDNSGLHHAHAYVFEKGILGWKRYYRTVVSPCLDNGERKRILHYSNPDVEYANRDTGDDDANNAKTIRDAAGRVAQNMTCGDFSAYLDGPFEICEGVPATVTVVLNSGQIAGPYTYKWRYKYDNGPWTNVNNQGISWFTVYPGNWLCVYIEVTVEDPTGIYIATAARTICSCDDGGGNGGERGIDILTTANSNKFVFYPNPTHSDGMLQSTILQKTDIQAKLIDILGITRQNYLIKDAHSTNQWPIDLEGIAAGTYYLHLTGEGINETIKIIKSN